MAFWDILKVSKYKNAIKYMSEENERLQRELDEIKPFFTVEHQQALDISERIEQLKRRQSEIEDELVQKTAAIAEQNNRISELKKQVIELEETALLQDFGLYHPIYDFATSAEFKDALDEIRKRQKQMVKDRTAATCATDWMVGGNKRQGVKMVNDNIKQILLTFNTECENVIDRVKFNNFDSMKTRIERSYEKLNKLNSSLEISISPKYCDLKIQELCLAFEYAKKKQEEKEYLREQREIQRENAKVQKELEAERKRIEKEQHHYQNQMRRLTEQYEAETDEARKQLLKDKMAAIENELLDLNKALKDVDYRQANERAGYVYIISNIGSFGDNVYKIGMTRRLDPMDRVDELGDASVPFRFDVHALIFSNDAPKLETALHKAFESKRVNLVNGRKEFYKVSLEEIEQVVRQNHDKTVEFVYVANAEQYRESEKIRETVC